MGDERLCVCRMRNWVEETDGHGCTRQQGDNETREPYLRGDAFAEAFLCITACSQAAAAPSFGLTRTFTYILTSCIFG